MGQFYRTVLASQRANGTLYNTYTTAKTVINQTELVPIPGNYMQVGTRFRVHAWGGLSNIVTTPGTVTFQVMMGTTAVWSSGAIQMTTTANTLTPFDIDIEIAMFTSGTGTSATFTGGGVLRALNVTIGTGANPAFTDTVIVVPVSSPAAGTGFDSTIAEIMDFWVGFSVSNSGNGIQLYSYVVEQLN